MNAATVPQQWLSKHFHKIITNNNGYNRLKSVKLSRVCQNFSNRREDENTLILTEKQQIIFVPSTQNNIENKCNSDKKFDANVSVKSDKYRAKTKRDGSFKFFSLRGRNNKSDKQNNRPVLTPVLMTFDKSINRESKTMNPDLKLSDISTEFDMSAFERKHREIIYELQRKRSALDECRQELNEAIMKQQELERLLLTEKHKKDNENLQNKLMINATQVLEEERQEMRKELNNFKIQLEIITSERNNLRDQVRAIQMENIKYKRQIEDYEGKERCHLVYQEDISEQQTRLRTTILHLSNMMQTLKKEQESIRKSDDSYNICAQLELAVKQLQKDKELIIKQRYQIENECIMKTAEISKLKDLLTNCPLLTSENKQQQITDYWMYYAKKLEDKLAGERDSVSQLSETLKLSNETQIRALKENEELMERLKESTVKNEKIDRSCQTVKDNEEITGDEKN